MDRAASGKIRRLEAESSPSARVRWVVGGKIDPLAANASGPLYTRGPPGVLRSTVEASRVRSPTP